MPNVCGVASCVSCTREVREVYFLRVWIAIFNSKNYSWSLLHSIPGNSQAHCARLQRMFSHVGKKKSDSGSDVCRRLTIETFMPHFRYSVHCWRSQWCISECQEHFAVAEVGAPKGTHTAPMDSPSHSWEKKNMNINKAQCSLHHLMTSHAHTHCMCICTVNGDSIPEGTARTVAFFLFCIFPSFWLVRQDV